jgi:phage shock protein E
MKKLFLITALTLLTITLAACAKEPGNQPSVESIKASDLATLIAANDAPFILDVRTQKEFAAGHVPGAVNIPHTELEARLAELNDHQDDTIIVYCRSGKRAGMAEEKLQQNGFTEISDLDGHMLGWEKDGHPVE